MRKPPIRTLGQQRGRTIIEIMIALTLGLVILAAALAVYSSSSSGSSVSEAESRLNEDGLVALTLLQQQLRQASYSKQVTATTAGYTYTTNLGTTGVRGCVGGFVGVTATFASLACSVTSGTSSQSDAIAIRYEADTNNTLTNATSTLPNTGSPTNCTGGVIWPTTTSEATAAASLSKFALADNRYYVANNASSGSPELTCSGANGTTTVGASTFDAAQPLLENVEYMSFLYGVAAGTSTTSPSSATQIVAYMTAAGIDSTYSSEPVGTRWLRVLAVKACIIVRSASKSPRYDGTDATVGTYYDCSSPPQLKTASDGYLRRAFTTTIMLRNRCLSGSTC